jgi:Leucine-rich repeat (LRR) protein
MKHEFLKYLEEKFYVDFNYKDRFVLDEEGNIAELYLEGNQHPVSDPKNIRDLSLFLPLGPYLKVLSIRNCYLKEDMSPIKDFIHLKQLRLSYTNYINKISGLENLTQLEVLDLSGNRIEKIEGLENLTNLKLLDLSVNGLGSNGYIKKIEGLDSLKKLEALYLHENEIQTIENINHLTNLKRLTLHTNEIGKYENMDALSKLTRFTIGYNLTVFPDLMNHILIEELGIQGEFDRIENLDYLESLHTVNIESGGKEVKNSSILLEHKYLKNIRVSLEYLKGTISPLFWNSEIEE